MINFLPDTCYECGHKLSVIMGKNGKYKLICDNEDCGGVALKKFQRGMLSFDISGVGPAIYKDLYDAGIRDISDLLSVTSEQLIDSTFFKSGRSLEKIIVAFKSIKVLKLSSIIESLQFDGVGNTISKEIEKFYSTGSYDTKGIEYVIREKIEDSNSDLNIAIRNILDKLSHNPNVTIQVSVVKKDLGDIKIVEFTGSPKEFGFNTKEDFEKEIEPFGYIHGPLNKDCTYLITDDITSTTGKMAKAIKLGVKTLTYGQLINLIKN